MTRKEQDPNDSAARFRTLEPPSVVVAVEWLALEMNWDEQAVTVSKFEGN